MTLQNQLSMLAQDVIDGNVDPLETYAEVKRIEAQLKEVKAVVEEAAIDEAQKFDKTFEHKSVIFELRQGRRIWNFKGIDVWDKAESKKKAVEKDLKTAFEQMEKGNIIANEDGEVLELPKCTFTKPSLVIKRVTR